MYCDWAETNGEYVCKCCGRVMDYPYIAGCPKGGTDQKPEQPNSNPPKLGDWTEQQLQKLGVTQENYKAAKEKFGLSPTCSCAARKEWLNKVSDWWRGQ